jgi:hypothetical protein
MVKLRGDTTRMDEGADGTWTAGTRTIHVALLERKNRAGRSYSVLEPQCM